MPLRVAQLLKSSSADLQQLKVLDLCSGCGVVGFELHFHLPSVVAIDFVEVQSVYQSYFEKNLELVKAATSTHSVFRFLNQNYDQLLTNNFANRYDVVVCNPPYFEKDQGRLSPNEFKNRCRFYLDSDFETLIHAILHVLQIGGQGFVLVRPLSEHKKNLLKQLEILIEGCAVMEQLEDIRGTHLIKITKTSAV